MGITLGALGLAAPLVNYAVGHISASVPDRHITVRAPHNTQKTSE